MLLQRYARRRAAPVLAMQLVTDGLVRLFGREETWVRSVRNHGMRMVDTVGPLRRLLAQPALTVRTLVLFGGQVQAKDFRQGLVRLFHGLWRRVEQGTFKLMEDSSGGPL